MSRLFLGLACNRSSSTSPVPCPAKKPYRYLMKIKFFGGAQEVGRSSILLKGEKRFMLDYGIKLGKPTEYPIGSEPVDAIILSHAHLDHSGAVPSLYMKEKVPTIGTKPTLELSELLLNDSLKIAHKDNKPAGFHERQLWDFSKHFISLDYRKGIRVGDFDIEMYDAGHVAGSAITLIENKAAKGSNKRFVYTGDFKLGRQMLHDGAETVECDVLITESTYALKEHPDRGELTSSFISEVREVLDSGGTALLPVFAVGRGQEMLALLHEHGLAERTYVDGMVNSATDIIMSHQDFLKNPGSLSKAVSESNRVRDRKDRWNALKEPAIILTTAGMLEGGPVMDYITRINAESRIFLTGYQVEGTNGRTLIEGGWMNIDGAKRRIRNRVSFYDFSAHAGMGDLYEYVRRSSPNTVVCVHGSAESSTAFAERLRGEGFEAHAPAVGDMIDLG